MKIFKKLINNICTIFNLPRFSEPPKIKVSKCKTLEIVPTKEYKKVMNEYIKNIKLEDLKVYINGKEIKGDDQMNKETIMGEEAFNELINGLEYIERLTKYGRKNIKYHVQKLQQENKKQKEVIDKAIEYITENVYENDNGCGGYWWEITDKYKLLDILNEVSDE